MSDQKTVCRAAVFPAASCESATWNEFTAALHTAWQESTALANWAVQQWCLADVVRTPNMEKLPPLPSHKAPQVQLYRLIKKKPEKLTPRKGVILEPYDRREHWQCATTSALSVLTMVYNRYKALRYGIVWRRDTAPPRFKYPCPYPVPAANWSPVWIPNSAASEQAGRTPGVEFCLPGVGRFTVRLRSGPDFVRQLTKFQQLIDGTAKKGEMAVYRQRILGDSHRAHGEERRVNYNIMIKLVGHFPVADAPKSGRAMLLRTLPDSLLEAVLETGPRIPLPETTEQVWLWAMSEERRWVRHWINNADHARGIVGWKAAYERRIREQKGTHERHLERLRDDRKYENRCNGKGKRLNQGSDARCLKMQRRIDSFVEETVAHVMKFARRQGVSVIIYDDREHSWCPRFPWHQLKNQIESKCAEFNIQLIGQLGSNGECDSPDDPDGPKGGPDEWQKLSTAAEVIRTTRRATTPAKKFRRASASSGRKSAAPKDSASGQVPPTRT